MGRAWGQKNSESECWNILWVRTDHLVMFAHPNKNVVPLLFTTPMLRQHEQPSTLSLPLPPLPPSSSTTPSIPVFPPAQAQMMTAVIWAPGNVFFTFFYQLTNLFPSFLDSNYVVTMIWCQHGTHIHPHMLLLQYPAHRVDDRTTQLPTTSRAERMNKMGPNNDQHHLGPR